MDNVLIESFEYEKKGNKDQIRWDIDKFQKSLFEQRLELNPSFANCFDETKNQTQEVKDNIKYYTTGERNRIIELIGMTGSGKSLSAITIAIDFMNKPLTVEDIHFTTDSLLLRSRQIGKSHVLILDEQTKNYGMGSDREKEEQKNLEDTTRKFGLNIIFCSPTTREHSTAHIQMELICINKKKRLTKIGIIGVKGRYTGYIIIKVIDNDNPIWVEYEKKKDIFIKTVLERNAERMDTDKMSLSLENHKLWKYCKTKEQKKVVAMKMYPNITIQEIIYLVENHALLKAEKDALNVDD